MNTGEQRPVLSQGRRLVSSVFPKFENAAIPLGHQESNCNPNALTLAGRAAPAATFEIEIATAPEIPTGGLQPEAIADDEKLYQLALLLRLGCAGSFGKRIHLWRRINALLAAPI
jgi:hypothetical protein